MVILAYSHGSWPGSFLFSNLPWQLYIWQGYESWEIPNSGPEGPAVESQCKVCDPTQIARQTLRGKDCTAASLVPADEVGALESLSTAVSRASIQNIRHFLFLNSLLSSFDAHQHALSCKNLNRRIFSEARVFRLQVCSSKSFLEAILRVLQAI